MKLQKYILNIITLHKFVQYYCILYPVYLLLMTDFMVLGTEAGKVCTRKTDNEKWSLMPVVRALAVHSLL